MRRYLLKLWLFARGLLALSLLAGYYLLSLVIAATAVALMVVGVRYRFPGMAFILLIATAGLSLCTAARVFFGGPKEPAELPGIAIFRDDAPELFALVDTVARDVGTRPPDEVRLMPDANAFVTERGGFMGFGRRRILALGYLDLRRSNRSELVATIAHELGHFGAGDTFIGPVVYRSHYVLSRAVGILSRETGDGGHYSVDAARSVLTAIMHGYASVALRVSFGIARAQELAADRVAVELAGADAHVRSLARMSHDIVTFDAFIAREIDPLAERAVWPRAFWEGYDAFEAATREEIAATIRDRKPDPHDTHPSLEERVRFAGTVVGAKGDEDTRPALDLLADKDATWTRLEELVSAKLGPCDWADAARIRGQAMHAEATETHAAYAALWIGGSWRDTARGALRCLAAEGSYRLVTASMPVLRQVNGEAWLAIAPVVLARSFGSVIAMALVEECGGRFVHVIGKPLLVEIGGEQVSPRELALEASMSHEGVARLARLLDTPAPAPAPATAPESAPSV